MRRRQQRPGKELAHNDSCIPNVALTPQSRPLLPSNHMTHISCRVAQHLTSTHTHTQRARERARARERESEGGRRGGRTEEREGGRDGRRPSTTERPADKSMVRTREWPPSAAQCMPVHTHTHIHTYTRAHAPLFSVVTNPGIHQPIEQGEGRRERGSRAGREGGKG